MKKIYAFGLILIIACNSSAIHGEHTDNTQGKDTVSPIVNTKQLNTPQEREDQIARLGQSVTMTVYDKGFSRIGKQNFTRFDISITNKSDQVITAVKGRFAVDDIFGDHLKNYNLKFDDTNIKPGKTIKITRYWDYDKTEREDAKIKTTPLGKLKINYEPEMVLFADGSSLK